MGGAAQYKGESLRKSPWKARECAGRIWGEFSGDVNKDIS